EIRGKPGRGPGWIGALIKTVVNLAGQIHSVAFGNLKRWAETLDEIQPAHGHGHASAREVAGAPAAAGEILGNAGMPRGGGETFRGFLPGDLPEGLHSGLAVESLLSGAVERGGAGIDEMENAVCRRAIKRVPRNALHGFGTPVSADVGKDLRGFRDEITEQHGSAIEGVIFRGHDIRRPDAIPVE